MKVISSSRTVFTPSGSHEREELADGTVRITDTTKHPDGTETRSVRVMGPEEAAAYDRARAAAPTLDVIDIRSERQDLPNGGAICTTILLLADGTERRSAQVFDAAGVAELKRVAEHDHETRRATLARMN